MCGIVGYNGFLDAKEILLKGLEKLEYRGYDSAGIAVHNEEGITVFKEKGRIADLRKAVDEDVVSTVGIGHTRWATHGVPNRRNAHPHQSANGRFTLVHNGVIENYHLLQKAYLKGIQMQSDTDTEVLVQLIELFVKEEGLSTVEAFRKTLSLVHGSYALALLDNEDAGTIYVAKNKSPLLVGVGEDFNVVASDAMAMLQVTDQFIELHDKEIVVVRRDSVEISKLDGRIVERAPYTAELDMSDIEKGTYPHYMLKEMDEQPNVVRKIIQAYEVDGELAIDEEILTALNAADRLYIIAAGTSYHSGLVGKSYFEKMAQIPVEVHISSEFGYNMPLLSEKPLFIFLSQSGETADSRQVLVKVKEMGYPALTITNVQGSTLSREADYTLLLHAGPEIAVASTKAYVAQLAVLAVAAYVAGKARGNAVDFDLKQELAIAATAIAAIIDSKEAMEQIAEDYLKIARNAFFIGRNLDFCVSLEGALKLKEISYIQAEGFAGGELKHGTIALIEEGTPVFALVTQEQVALNIRGNVKEVVARGAHACIIASEGLEEEGDRLVLPRVHPLLTPLVSVVPLQLISYYAALHRRCDVDKPRNLAKSVTVE
ncbi:MULTISPECIES: glutamine--fructose-6-phosphate transaminase (isomerizing) [Bacillales]|uniref:Glutamine--fructose-6-phosphate aminotransferase [isomerizing] n=1 Tax=Lysinibacillus louembei TaxID=1470088 RepID=A0ABZ0RYN1_9BACI|nr:MULTISPECIES: glutamine--fructose-6-phosphate transaminase (isomerizing) [Bacillales]MCT6924776.1 glutamine--fructose-6-phosphate transaminase (isomerizing) [Metasolibacillus sp.]MCT6941044.1 glutamine--fructose-6-phosphate transaminase (isomerizing) [Metasolibacillus sp.]WPK13260.1 glutamine--fructose-6-phosphate transaminase (isomerizing) [Lysinibacillus louembei]